MPRRLVIFCDGTWNHPDQVHDGRPCPTNVVKLARALRATSADGTPQFQFYDRGVGTGRWERFRGGAFGIGLSKNVEEAYRFLVDNFDEGDAIYLFGFSRGAFTARSTAGLIRKCGILHKRLAGMVPKAYEFYRSDVHPDHAEAVGFRRGFSRETRIRFIGVWDTVGALGVPMRGFGKWFKSRFEFHDVELSSRVDFGYHALAIDEERYAFRPAVWNTKAAPGQTVEQVWFPGAHSNVGGGFKNAGLSDAALLWMRDKAKAVGLAFDDGFLEGEGDPDPLGEIHRSRSGFYRLSRPHSRVIGAARHGYESVHASAHERMKLDPEYRPANLLDYLRRTGGGAVTGPPGA